MTYKVSPLFISIHAPREGGDLRGRSFSFLTSVFQSTPPARGATRTQQYAAPAYPHFNPRPPRGGRQRQNDMDQNHFKFQSTPPARGATCLAIICSPFVIISIHAPREGGDLRSPLRVRLSSISIHAPREGGDRDFKNMDKRVVISIHAPREGGDTGVGIMKSSRIWISIHAPREGGD